MTLLTREMALNPPPLPTEDIELPEFGGTVRVRTWSGATFDELCAYLRAQGDNSVKLNRAASIAVSVIDADGERMYAVEDAPTIQNLWPSSAIARVWTVIARMNDLED